MKCIIQWVETFKWFEALMSCCFGFLICVVQPDSVGTIRMRSSNSFKNVRTLPLKDAIDLDIGIEYKSIFISIIYA